jgi:5-methylcytosine-specific restriction endonuclease McrA
MPYADPDERRAYYREWKKGAKKRRSNSYYDSAKHANQRAELYGVVGRITTADARAVLNGATCHYCGSVYLLGLDHVVPMAKGGPNIRANLVPACRACNSSKYRGNQPHRWAREYDACTRCKRTASKHHGHGLCNACAQHIKKYGPDPT